MITYDQTTENLNKTAQKLITEAGDKKVWLFHGDMGAGKTTLIKTICAQLGVTDEVTSPTFSIVNEYQIEQNSILYHIDLYRLENSDELIEIGFEDIVFSNCYCFIEWPQIAKDFLPSNCFSIEIEFIDANHRKILFL